MLGKRYASVGRKWIKMERGWNVVGKCGERVDGGRYK